MFLAHEIEVQADGSVTSGRLAAAAPTLSLASLSIANSRPRRGVMEKEVDEAVVYFAPTMGNTAHPLQPHGDVGFGYHTLGQAHTTLSGGEAQRIKLVTELGKARDNITKVPHALYVVQPVGSGTRRLDGVAVVAA